VEAYWSTPHKGIRRPTPRLQKSAGSGRELARIGLAISPGGSRYHWRVRYLGIDPGGKRMGLAIGNDLTGTASPLQVLPYGGVGEAAQQIARIAREQGAEVLVLGLPSDVEGRETPACARSRALAAALEALGWTVELQPEYLTSNEARRRARDLGLRHGEPVDHLAAQVLLEEFLGGLPCRG